MTQFTDDVDKTIAKLEARLNTPDPGMASATYPSITTPPGFDEKNRIHDSLIECERIKQAVAPPESSLPSRELRQRHQAVQLEHGLIDPNTPRI